MFGQYVLVQFYRHSNNLHRPMTYSIRPLSTQFVKNLLHTPSRSMQIFNINNANTRFKLFTPSILDRGFISRKYNSDIKTRLNLLSRSIITRNYNNMDALRDRTRSRKSVATGFNYTMSLLVLMVGVSYATVPLYRMFCQATGFGGTPMTKFRDKDVGDELKNMIKIEDRPIRIKFESQVNRALENRWSFKPQQDSVDLVPGDTALAFFTAENKTDEPITGISSYNIWPYQAGQYFNKIQCFCFEEQRLNPHEEVDMPVFFYVDPEIDEDPQMENIDELILSYTFFEAKSGVAPQAFAHARQGRQ